MILHYKTAVLAALLPMLQAADIFGRGHGLDHVGIAVHDLKQAEDLFRDSLGFTIGMRGWLPDGVVDSSIDLKNQGQYLELIAVTDRTKASVRQGDLVRFLDRREGPFFVGLDTASAAHTASFLRGHGWKIEGPVGNSWTPEGVREQFPEGWLRVRFTGPEFPGSTLFFIEYHEKVYKQLEKKYPQIKEDPRTEVHANGATALRAAWIAVRDLDAATHALERAGLKSGRRLAMDALEAKGREVQAGAGSILLVAGASTKNPVTPWLESRGESVMGITLEVADLEQARRALQARLHRDLPVYEGAFGRSILIPAEVALDTYIEFCEKRR